MDDSDMKHGHTLEVLLSIYVLLCVISLNNQDYTLFKYKYLRFASYQNEKHNMEERLTYLIYSSSINRYSQNPNQLLAYVWIMMTRWCKVLTQPYSSYSRTCYWKSSRVLFALSCGENSVKSQKQ